MLGLSRNSWLVILAQPFGQCISPAIVLISSFVGMSLAPSAALATLPLSVMLIGMTLGTAPAALLMNRFGRKAIFMGAMIYGALSSLVAAAGIQLGSFLLFLIGITLIGSMLAVIQQFRFAAAENALDPKYTGRAVSILLLGNVAAAFIGTELAAWGQNLLSVEYAGSFISLTIAFAIGFFILLFFTNQTTPVADVAQKEPAHWREFISRPALILAVATAAIGFGVMSFVMTATPIAMHELMGHSMGDTKWVIQSHIMAMYLPSLVTGELIRKFGLMKVIYLGLAAMIATTVFGLIGAEVFHYWWALVLLGIGWNFLFIGGTTLLTTTYTASEKFRVQALNDFSVFVFQSLSSLSAGIVLYLAGWNGVIIIALVPTLLLTSALFIWRKPLAQGRTA